jgi:hypothetical protein
MSKQQRLVTKIGFTRLVARLFRDEVNALLEDNWNIEHIDVVKMPLFRVSYTALLGPSGEAIQLEHGTG